VTKQTYRRRAGIILGALTGLIFGLISQGVNPFLLPGIPLYQPPFGMIGNMLLAIGVGLLLVLLSAWMDASVPGVLLSAAVGALLMLVAAFITGRTPLGMLPVTTIGLIFLWIPFTGMLIPVMGVIRTAINNLTDSRSSSEHAAARLWLPLVVVVAFGVLGATNVYSPAARAIITHNHKMLQQGLVASSMAAMPQPLLGPEMEDFSAHASQNYRLTWDDKNLNLYAIPRVGGPEYLMSVVIARFDNGWNVVCLYPNAESQPRCRSLDELP
jgi:hypothetical protein